MQIGEVIRKYRKELNMTQEEMANRLGVTTPAVNKWENGNTCPDIMLLAPIARLLNITLDTLLSFQSDLTQEEINNFVYEADLLFKEKPYEEVFQWIKQKMELYPNCNTLIWQLAVILDAQRMFKQVQDSERYDEYILDCYKRVLNSRDEKLKSHAADSLFGYYLRKDEYETAEKYLKYFSEENPERKRKQAVIYSKTGRTEEAYKAYEEMLFSGYQIISMVFNSLHILAMEEGDMPKARRFVEKQIKLAGLFEMGTYHEVSCQLDLAVKEKDTDKIKELMNIMLENVDTVTAFTNSELYAHMAFKEPDSSFGETLKQELIKQFEEIKTGEIS